MSKLDRLLLTLTFLPFLLHAQVSDNFSDGDLTNNPTWLGDAANFIVNPAFQLQLNAPAAGNSLLYLPTAVADSAVWEIYFRMDFSPSGSNSLHIVLQSDQNDLLNGNGYYLFLGETGSDDAIHFYRMDDGNTTLLASASTGAVANMPTVRLQMKRQTGGNWTLFADYAGGQNFQTEFTLTDATYGGSNDQFFGIQCDYTATRTDKFFFDDISVAPLVPDTLPPVLLSANAISATEVEIFFDENLEENAATEPANYSINNGIGQPAAAFLDAADKTLVHLSLQTPLSSPNDYSLTVDNIADLEGNVSGAQAASFTFFEPDTAAEFDILINEIMADPTPAVTLPSVEFIELYNRSEKTLDLEGFGFSSGGTPRIFPGYLLQPKSYIIVCDNSNVDSLASYGEVIGLAGFPNLVNSGDELTLTDATGHTIHFVSYSLETYRNPQKANGGWTLELINPLAPCQGESNWRSSNSLLGGTPGQPNSVLNETPDSQGPDLLRAFSSVDQPDRIALFFNKGLEKTAAQDIGNFSISNGIEITAASLLPPANQVVHLQLAAPLAASIVYEITLADAIADCTGNFIQNKTATIALPEPIEPMDIIINEVLFNPASGGVDFVEVFNRSAKVLNLGDLVIGNLREGMDTVVREIVTNKLIFPGEYAVFTSNPGIVKANYTVENMDALLTNDLPALNNDAGNVTLFRGGAVDVVVVDAFDYQEDFHHPLLDDPDGVSLERLSPDAPTQDRNNWHSAAGAVGFATPTYQNSQSIPDPNSATDFFDILEKKLSPDGDGFQDFLLINYKTDGPGYTAQVKIYDIEGRPVKTLINNELLPTEGFLRWDGFTDRGDKARVGIYIVYAQVFRSDGTVKEFKETCVVASQL